MPAPCGGLCILMTMMTMMLLSFHLSLPISFSLFLSVFLIVPHYVSLSLFLFAFQTFHLSPLLLVIVKPWPGSAKGAMRNVFANDVEL